MRGSFQPVGEVHLGHPAPPADLQPLIQIQLVDLEDRGSGREEAVEEQLGDENVPVPLLQRIIKGVVPLIEQNRDADQAELGRDHRREQDAPGPAVLGAKIR
jgi:hypothetical protein